MLRRTFAVAIFSVVWSDWVSAEDMVVLDVESLRHEVGIGRPVSRQWNPNVPALLPTARPTNPETA